MKFNFTTGYCPQCGELQWIEVEEKMMQCLHCAFTMYKNMAAAVVAIIRNEKNEVLFTIRKNSPAKGKLDLPGGFVDPGETAEQALIREVKEELNLQVTGFRFLKSLPNEYHFKNVTYQTLDLVFECLVDNFAPFSAGDDVAGARFISPGEVKTEEIGLKSIRRLVAELRENQSDI